MRAVRPPCTRLPARPRRPRLPRSASGGSARCPRRDRSRTCCISRPTAPASRSAPASQKAARAKPRIGKAGTREVKLARLFTVSGLDHNGRPVTDPGSSTYLATFDGKNSLAGLVKAEYLRRGGEHFRQVIALGDGAAWISSMTEDIYPHATHIVDIYHAREHLHDLTAHLAFITPDPAQWLASRLDELDSGDIEAHHRPALPSCQRRLERRRARDSAACPPRAAGRGCRPVHPSRQAWSVNGSRLPAASRSSPSRLAARWVCRRAI